MMTVLRFSFPVSGMFDVEMPQGARLLQLGTARAKPCLWALVDEVGPKVRRRFRLTATTEPIPDLAPDWKFVGSVLIGGNDCHLWDLGEDCPE
jgi:hypothetical protein